MLPNDQQPTDEPDVTPVVPSNPENAAPSEPAEVSTSQPVDTTGINPEPTPAVTPAEAPVNPMTPASDVAVTKNRFGFLKTKKAKLGLLVIAILIVLGAGSAGAYYGVILPNKPENVLKSAIANTVKERQISFDGNVDVEAADKAKAGAMQATSVSFKGGGDLDKHAIKSELSVTVSGIKVQGEIRYLDQTAYVKIGDLGAIKNLAKAYAPGADDAISKVENQWIEIDKTLVKQANADCVLDANATISDQDLRMLSDAYEKNSFVTINSTSSEAVNGKAATKFELSINDDKASEYAKNFDNLAIVKQLKSCSKETTKADYAELKDGDATPLTLWVDKGTKRIVKLASHSTDQDAKKDNFKGSGSVTFTYGPVTVEKPANAKPVMTLISEFAPLFSGGVQGANSLDPTSLLSL